MPFKTFTASVLSSSDMNTYLMKQAVITCTSGTRPASPVQGMTIYETDTSMYATYDGSAWGYLGGWKSYTPALTNWAVGNGTLTGQYTQIGKTVSFRAIFTAGSTSTYGSTPRVSLPVAAAGVVGTEHLGPASAFDTSATAGTPCATVAASTTVVGAYAIGTGFVASTIPFTWATGDVLVWRGTYDAA